MKNILNENDLNVDTVNATTINTETIKSNIRLHRTTVLHVEQNTPRVYTVSEVLGGHITRNTLSPSSSITDTLPSAAAFVAAGFRKGDVFNFIVDIWNNNSAYSFFFSHPADPPNKFKTNIIGTSAGAAAHNAYTIIIVNDTAGSESYWLYRLYSTTLNTTMPVTY